MQITSESLNVVFTITQTVVIIVGTVFAIRRWMTEPLREQMASTQNQLEELKEETDQRFRNVNKDLKTIENRLHSLEVELPKTYIRQDQFLAFHNKTEAMLYRKLDDITADLRTIQKFLMEGKHERRSN
jgi:cob(I)alamin adenosyltransferase